MTDSPPRSPDKPPGFDEDDPYADVNLDTFPSWWRDLVTEYRAHDMRPYRPPRFADHVLTPVVIHDLEAEFDVTIQIRAMNPHETDDWHITVDGSPIASINRTRVGDGYTRYEITASEFKQTVREALTE